jgi:ribosome-associated translation inhibitor RaiA
VQQAEPNIHISGAELFAKAQSDNLNASIAQLVNKLE